jgi:hypothetical protein
VNSIPALYSGGPAYISWSRNLISNRGLWRTSLYPLSKCWNSTSKLVHGHVLPHPANTLHINHSITQYYTLSYWQHSHMNHKLTVIEQVPNGLSPVQLGFSNHMTHASVSANLIAVSHLWALRGASGRYPCQCPIHLSAKWIRLVLSTCCLLRWPRFCKLSFATLPYRWKCELQHAVQLYKLGNHV